MEAMWTRFLPTVREFQKIIENGRLGDPVVLWADFLVDFDINSRFSAKIYGRLTHVNADIPKTHRILDPMLGGGGLLDL